MAQPNPRQDDVTHDEPLPTAGLAVSERHGNEPLSQEGALPFEPAAQPVHARALQRMLNDRIAGAYFEDGKKRNGSADTADAVEIVVQNMSRLAGPVLFMAAAGGLILLLF